MKYVNMPDKTENRKLIVNTLMHMQHPVSMKAMFLPYLHNLHLLSHLCLTLVCVCRTMERCLCCMPRSGS